MKLLETGAHLNTIIFAQEYVEPPPLLGTKMENDNIKNKIQLKVHITLTQKVKKSLIFRALQLDFGEVRRTEHVQMLPCRWEAFCFMVPVEGRLCTSKCSYSESLPSFQNKNPHLFFITRADVDTAWCSERHFLKHPH